MTDHAHHAMPTSNGSSSDVASEYIKQGLNDFFAGLDGKEPASIPIVEAHANHAAHSSHAGHSAHEGHMMKMWFHGGYEEVILFDCWRISTLSGLLISCIAIFIMGAMYEGLKWSRVHLQSRLSNSVTPISRRRPLQLFLPGLYIIQLVLAYWLMLIVMTYNSWLTVAVILGAGFGHWIFAVVNPFPCDELMTDACH